MDAVESLNQTVWERKYHVAFVPETRARSVPNTIVQPKPRLLYTRTPGIAR